MTACCFPIAPKQKIITHQNFYQLTGRVDTTGVGHKKFNQSTWALALIRKIRQRVPNILIKTKGPGLSERRRRAQPAWASCVWVAWIQARRSRRSRGGGQPWAYCVHPVQRPCRRRLEGDWCLDKEVRIQDNAPATVLSIRLPAANAEAGGGQTHGRGDCFWIALSARWAGPEQRVHT